VSPEETWKAQNIFNCRNMALKTESRIVSPEETGRVQNIVTCRNMALKIEFKIVSPKGIWCRVQNSITMKEHGIIDRVQNSVT
jgi:hypothetical protein